MPSKSYMATETPITWTDTGGDKLLDLGGLLSDAVACGAYHDLGVAPRPDWFEVEVRIDGFTAAPTVGHSIDIFMTESNDASNFDGAPTTAPTATVQGTVTKDQTKNLVFVGSLRVASTSADGKLQGRFVTRLTGRYVAPVIHNGTGNTLKSSGDAHVVKLTPIPPEGQ